VIMATPEDAMKAVVILTEIVADIVNNPTLYDRHLRELESLKMGCEALLQDRRGSNFAQAIITRQIPEPPYANK